MLVVVIIGIMASIALPSYQRYVDRSYRAAAQQFMMEAVNRAEQFRLDRRQYPADLDAIGMAVPDDVDRFFTVTGEADADATPPFFRITAEPKTTRHVEMTLSSNGERTPASEWN
jgi:type IV pilus assembly protein PilE